MQMHVSSVKLKHTDNQHLNSSSVHTATCEDIFQTEGENVSFIPQKESTACYCPIVLPFHKVIAIHFKKQEWSLHTLQPGLFLCDSPSLLFVCQSF